MANDITELMAVDFALGDVVAGAFSNLAANGPKNYIDFLSRPVREKIFRAEHEDAGGLVRKISNAEKGRWYTVNPPPISKPPMLPVVAYYRKPGLSNGEDQASVMNKGMFNHELLASMKITIIPISLEYSMTFAAWDKPTLDKMQIAWYAYIAQHARANSRFSFPSQIGEETVDCYGSFEDPKTVMFMDTSPQKSEAGRIYSVSTEFTINTQVFYGDMVTYPDPIRVRGGYKFIR